MKTDARVFLGLAILVWWLPTIVLMASRVVCRGAYFRARLYQVRALRLTGRLDAALRVLERLEADAAKAARRSQPSRWVEPR